VDGALDGFLGGLGRLGLFRLLRDEHPLGRIHHRPDGGRFVFRGLAALGQVGGALLFLVLDGSGLDDPERGLGRFRGGLGGRCLRGLGGGSGRSRRGGCLGGLRGGLRSGSGRGRRGGLFGGGDFTRASLGRLDRLTLGTFLLFALASLRRELFFLQAQALGLGVGFLLATAQLFLVRLGARDLVGRRRHLVALDEGALLAHFDLDGARLAARIRLLDLARGLARQRDLLALAARDGAVRGAQVIEQARLVALGDGVVCRRLADAGRLQLLEQRRRRAIELGGELGDGCRSHRVSILAWSSLAPHWSAHSWLSQPLCRPLVRRWPGPHFLAPRPRLQTNVRAPS
jgi:hypothetical protein